MLRPLLIIALLIPLAITAQEGNRSSQHNLEVKLAATTDPMEQMTLYRHLADVAYETPKANSYLVQLVDKARQVEQNQVALEALSELSINYMHDDKLDSARYYIALIHEIAPTHERERWTAYLDMRLFNAELLTPSAKQAIEEKVDQMKNRDLAKESIYSQIAIEYCLGQALSNKKDYKGALDYMSKAYDLAKTLTLNNSYDYLHFLSRRLASIYTPLKENEQAVAVLKESLAFRQQYYDQYIKNTRPFYPIDNDYCLYYSALMINNRLLSSAEISLYLNKLSEQVRRATTLAQKYTYVLAINNYHLAQNEWRPALRTNDSLISYAKQIAHYNLPGLYKINALCYSKLNQHKEALDALTLSYRLQDSIQRNSMEERLNQMRVEHDVNRLNYENSQLELRNKRIMVITLSIILLMVAGLCGLLYYHLRRERRSREKMRLLMLRAEESEKLKTGFINSICHEIRTPLNGIVGFSHLVLDPSLDAEERATFPAEIQQNADQLLSLIDSMLEVANLDVSDEPLPCELTDIEALCRNAHEHYMKSHKTGSIIGITETDSNLPNAMTNKRYLTLVLDNLLANAYKFTEQGSVSLGCSCHGDTLRITITDTGCGIPAAKHQEVFGRFTKLDTYKPGNGLGLYLCQLIIRRLAGKIYIDPAYTAGTRVVVELPNQSN